MTPLASPLQWGASRPPKAGTKYTPASRSLPEVPDNVYLPDYTRLGSSVLIHVRNTASNHNFGSV